MKTKRTFRRTTALILTLCMLMGIVPAAIAADPASGGPMTVTVMSQSGMPGDTIQVPVQIQGNPGLASLKFSVEYDTLLELTNVAFNSAFGNMVTAPQPYTNPQSITMISPLSDITANGLFATLTFQISDIAPDNYSAAVNVTFRAADIFNGAKEPVEMTAVNGVVNVYHGIPGDVNNDRSVDTMDAIDLFRYVAGWSVDLDAGAVDVNGDGDVDTEDAIDLFRFVAGWEGITLVRHSHVLAAVEAKQATCQQTGSIAHWRCYGCGKCYSDAEGANEIDPASTVLPASGHPAQYEAGKPAGCTEPGVKAHWHCETCGGNFADDACTIPMEDTVIPASGHDLTRMSEKAATCTAAGTVTYWHCETCGKNYSEETAEHEMKLEDIEITPAGHALQHREAKTAECLEDGCVEHWFCPACGGYFTDSAGTTAVDISVIVLPATGHGENLQHVEAKPATVDEMGNEEYWHCTACGNLYGDSAAEEKLPAIPWIDIVPSYSIIFRDNKNDPSSRTVKFPQNEILDLTAPEQLPEDVLGYQFDGWYSSTIFDDASKVDTVAKGNTDDMILHAKWTPIKYNITYHDGAKNLNQTEYTIEDEVVLTDPEWSGLEFAGWTDLVDEGQVEFYTNLAGRPAVKIPRGTTGNIELQAKWNTCENRVVPVENVKLSAQQDPETGIYYFVYDVGRVENIRLDMVAEQFGKNGAYGQTLTIGKSLSLEKTRADQMAITVSDSYTRTKEFQNSLDKLIGVSSEAELGMSINVEGGVPDLFKASLEANWGVTLGSEEKTTRTTVDGTSNSYTSDQERTIQSALEYAETMTTSSEASITISSDLPNGTYAWVHTGTLRVFGLVTYDPATEHYTVNTYSVLTNMKNTVLYYKDEDTMYNTACASLPVEIPAEEIKQIVSSGYCVQYDANGGDGKMPISLFTVGEEGQLAANQFTRIGYTFDYWTLTPEGGGAVIFDTVRDLAVGGQVVTLYAHWKPHAYKVVYDGNGATYGSMEPSEHIYDTSKTLSENKFKRTYIVTFDYNGNGQANSTATSEYTFNGWLSDVGKPYGDMQEVKNLTSDEPVVKMSAQWMGDNVLLSEPNRVGYKFAGWYSSKECLESTKVPNPKEYLPSKDITLYAKWTAKSFNVVYHANDGTAASFVDENKPEYDARYTVRDNTFTRGGYAFWGWSTDPNAAQPTYFPGGGPHPEKGGDTQYWWNHDLEDNAVVDLYAVWTPTEAYTRSYRGASRLIEEGSPFTETYATVLNKSALQKEHGTLSVKIRMEGKRDGMWQSHSWTFSFLDENGNVLRTEDKSGAWDWDGFEARTYEYTLPLNALDKNGNLRIKYTTSGNQWWLNCPVEIWITAKA